METQGYIERCLVNALREWWGEPTGVQDVLEFTQDVGSLTGDTPDRDGLEVSIRQAFYNLEDKGLAEAADDAIDDYEPDDERITEWVGTQATVEEYRDMQDEYEDELNRLMKRYGRPDPTVGTEYEHTKDDEYEELLEKLMEEYDRDDPIRGTKYVVD